jgi:hypothetical protein
MEPDMAMVKEMQIESKKYKEVAKVPNSTAFSYVEKEERISEQQNQKLITVKNRNYGINKVISTDGQTFRVMYDANIECLNVMFDRDEPNSDETTTAMVEMSQVLVDKKRLDEFLMEENMMTTTPKVTNVENLQVKGKQIKKIAKKARQKATKDVTEETGTWKLECTNLDCKAGAGGAPFKTPALMPEDALDYLILHRESAHSHNVEDAKESTLRITSPNHQNLSLAQVSQATLNLAADILSTEQPVITELNENRSKKKDNVTMEATTEENETAIEGLIKNYVEVESDEKDRAEEDAKTQQGAEYVPLTNNFDHFLKTKTTNEFDEETKIPIRFDEKDQVGVADKTEQTAVNMLTDITCVPILEKKMTLRTLQLRRLHQRWTLLKNWTRKCFPCLIEKTMLL